MIWYWIAGIVVYLLLALCGEVVIGKQADRMMFDYLEKTTKGETP